MRVRSVQLAGVPEVRLAEKDPGRGPRQDDDLTRTRIAQELGARPYGP